MKKMHAIIILLFSFAIFMPVIGGNTLVPLDGTNFILEQAVVCDVGVEITFQETALVHETKEQGNLEVVAEYNKGTTSSVLRDNMTPKINTNTLEHVKYSIMWQNSVLINNIKLMTNSTVDLDDFNSRTTKAEI